MQRTFRESPKQEELSEAIQAAIASHLLWLQSEGRDGRRANFAGESLRGVSLRGQYLAEANFRGCDLSGADLSGANVQGADFSQAILSQANFRGALLDGANLSRAQAAGLYLDEASLVSVNGLGAELSRMSAKGADFSGAKLRDAMLDDAQLSASLLVRADLRYVKATQADFSGANLSQADARDAVFDGARFVNASLHQTQLKNSSLEQVMLSDCDFGAAMDLPACYQSQGFALEKEAIDKELDALARRRGELDQFEAQIQTQRREILQQRKLLASLKPLEEETGAALLSYMHMTRRLSMFWFMAVSLAGTLLAAGALSLPPEILSQQSVWMLAAVAMVLLGVHFYAAMHAFKVAQRFAGYVRLRQDKIAQIKALEKPSEIAFEDDPNDSGVRYL